MLDLQTTISALHRDYLTAATSPVAAVSDCLSRAEAGNELGHAFVTFMRESALAEARASESRYQAGRPLSPLDGVPVAIKDFFDTQGIRTTAGFAHFVQRVPSTDAEMVRALRTCGAIIIGKTNMDAFGRGTTGMESGFGQVRNPHWPDHVAGGSSSGSAAAVADHLCYLSIDTDAAGSTRLPAACCGNVGFKPTYGLLSGEGILADQPVDEIILTFAHVGMQAGTVGDMALAFSALTGATMPTRLETIRVAPVSNAVRHPSMQKTLDAALATLGQVATLGTPVETPFHLAAFNVASVAAHRSAINELLFSSADALALATLAAPVPSVTEATAAGELAVRQDNVFIANYFGVPAITLPVGRDANGLPVSLQLMARPGRDGQLLALAVALEQRL